MYQDRPGWSIPMKAERKQKQHRKDHARRLAARLAATVSVVIAGLQQEISNWSNANKACEVARQNVVDANDEVTTLPASMPSIDLALSLAQAKKDLELAEAKVAAVSAILDWKKADALKHGVDPMAYIPKPVEVV